MSTNIYNYSNGSVQVDGVIANTTTDRSSSKFFATDGTIQSAGGSDSMADDSTTIAITGTDNILRRQATSNASWTATYSPDTNEEKEFLLVITNTSTTSGITITHPTSGYNKVVNLYGSSTLVIPASKTGEIAVTIGKNSTGSYMSFTCEIEDLSLAGTLEGVFIPLSGTTTGHNVTGNIKLTDDISISTSNDDNMLMFDGDTIRIGSDEGITDVTIDCGDSINLNANTTVDGNLTASSIRSTGILNVTGATSLSAIATTTHISPSADNTYNLGTSSTRWNSIYGNIGRYGTIYTSDGVFESSDRRLKTIQGEVDLDKAYALIDKCSTILYYLNEDPDQKEQIGVIAQEIQEFFPEIVTENEKGFLSVDYSRLTVIILRVLKDLIDRVSKLENK